MGINGHIILCEDYVSFEVAKLLKEKGFDGVSTIMYKENGKMCINPKSVVSWRLKYWYPCLTLQMAMKWLREVHNIHIIAEPCLGEGNEPNLSFNRWFWTILKEEGEYKPIRKIDEFTNYEQACEAAIKYCLEHLI